MGAQKYSTWSISVRPRRAFCLPLPVLTTKTDMINMIKLEFTPKACCWVHKRGQAQGILAVYVSIPFFTGSGAYERTLRSVISSEQNSGSIRLYDGRGDGKPLETVEKLHRFPVHLMTVRFSGVPYGPPLTSPDSTVTGSIASSRRMKVALSSIGGRASSSSCRTTCPDCGVSRARQTCTSSRKYVFFPSSPPLPDRTFAVKINADVYHTLPRLVIVCHILPARPTNPYLLILDGKNDEKVRRVARGDSRDAAGRHGRVQS
jgi:hypothetical protein